MPYGSGWTGASYTTPPSGSSAGSVYTPATGSGNSASQTPTQASGGPSWTGGLLNLSPTIQQGMVFAAIVVFLAAWHAHGYSLIE